MIVFPMAGLSRRFTLAGYKVPKYMLDAGGKTLFQHSVESFAEYFDRIPFLFIARNINETGDFIIEECKHMGISNYEIAMLDTPTKGQAETVFLGVKKASLPPDTPLTIFNIDTFRQKFSFPKELDLDNIDGYLEVFIGSGKNWSYVKPISPDSNRVAETAEKREISQFCCTGLYHFSKLEQFEEAFNSYCQIPQENWDAQELYVAPMYNQLINKGSDIRFHVIDADRVIFCGTPDEYNAFVANIN
jgi:hypothetical protein